MALISRVCFLSVLPHFNYGFFGLFQKKTADDFVASNDEESEDEDGGDVDEEGNEVKKSKLKKEKKEKKRLV